MIPWDEFWSGMLQVLIIIGLVAAFFLLVLGVLAWTLHRLDR